ncbi:21.9 kDa heat shock protein [Brachypodium distachyon]|uniref:SHSP domain-containing protein n=1 Tax=Brachypodium distachyon TaxID=15368 RepID=A0A0Q3ER43_BRADI|nr:21.9 kDa heat shock protein [Brachypodium distachyon]KQJ88772.1 hypothetical protein BRADI_4g21070v3 [Brachypodium distachyon]|eukprot:XP_003576111.1 21.9 kDa heat shock protein [Brachypodium distachyon]
MAPLAKHKQALFTAAVLLLLAMAPAPAAALVPYGGATGLWDLMLDADPFRVLEHSTPQLAAPRSPPSLALARCDWKETPEAHVISVDVPGVRRGDMKVEVEENRVLRISGERRPEPEEKREEGGERWHRAERAAGRFWRRFRLPAGADMDSVAARLEDGVLTVTVPKVAGHRGKEPRVISIAGEEGDAAVGGKASEVEATKAEV